jgi:hypothetical protein
MGMEVKTQQGKPNFYLFVQTQLKLGKNPSSISKEFSISKQKLNYYIRGLKAKGIIEKKGYGTWEVKTSPKDTRATPKLVRGHAFIWTVRLPQEIKGWNKRKEILTTNKIPFKEVGILKTTLRVLINNKKVWLGNSTLTIYEPHSFYGENAFESRKYAVISLLSCLHALESKFGINLKPYTFKPAREHYGLIKNDLAIQCNERGEKIHVKDDLEGEWLWIDDSLELGELETGGTKAPDRNIQVQRWWNDNKKHNFEVTPSFILNAINGVSSNQEMYNKNFESHVSSIQQLGNSAQANAKAVELLSDVILELKEEIKGLKNERNSAT